MSMSKPKDTKEEHGCDEQQVAQEQADAGLTGEGAASALAHMISRGQQQRNQGGQADDAAGSRQP